MSAAYAFHGYSFDADTGEVADAAGDPVVLRPKTVAVLSYLIENRDSVLTKEAILQAVWPDRVVEDQAVFQSISEIRSAFSPFSTVQTLRGKGYRWVAPTSAPAAAKPRRAVRWAMAGAASLLVGLIAALAVAGGGVPGGAPGAVHAEKLAAAASAHIADGEFEAAEALLSVLAENEPDDLETALELGYVRKRLDNLQSAEALASRVYAASREGTQLRTHSALLLSEILTETGRTADARRLTDEAAVSASAQDDMLLFAAAQEQKGRLSLIENRALAAETYFELAAQIYEGLCPDTPRASRVAQWRATAMTSGSKLR